jgi:hypothetical protein
MAFINYWCLNFLEKILNMHTLNYTPPIEQSALENVNSCHSIKFTFYLVTSGAQNFNLYLIVVYFFNTSVN